MTPTKAMQGRLTRVFNACEAVATHEPPIPYRYSGAHNIQWLDSLSYAQGIGLPGAGRDCSSALSIALRAGGLCWNPRPPFPLSTAQFIQWGVPGPGVLLTMAVVNTQAMAHCAIRFNLDYAAKLGLGWNKSAGALAADGWFQAPHTGLNVGWLNLGDLGPYILRHWAGS